jgi:hypothetical protein
VLASKRAIAVLVSKWLRFFQLRGFRSSGLSFDCSRSRLGRRVRDGLVRLGVSTSMLNASGALSKQVRNMI